MKKFKVGERYKVTKACFYGCFPSNYYKELGDIIEIRRVLENAVCYKTMEGGTENLGYFEVESRFANGLVPVHNSNKIVITTDGKTTTAKMYSGKTIVKSAKADCHPDDEFDFEKGTGIAISRLLDWDFVPDEDTLDEEHFYNGKVVCVKNENLESYFTVGKIYDVVDGLLKADVKDRQLDNIRSIDYLNSVFSGNRLKFLEIVE